MNSLNAVCLVAALIITSCGNCEDDSRNDDIAVQYRINTEEPIVAEVQYKNAQGQIIAENLTGLTDTMWHRTVFVDNPFQAYKKVKFLNISNRPIDYTLRLFVDGSLVHTKAGSIMPESEGADEIQYSVLD